MTRRDHHVSFGAVPGHQSHHHHRGGGGGSSCARTNTAESDSSFLSIRNLGEATDLDDDVDVVSAVGAMRAFALKSFRGGNVGDRGGGGGGSGSSTPRAGHHCQRGGSDGTSPCSPRTASGVLGWPRRVPSVEAATESPTKSAGIERGGSRRRAWTAGDVDMAYKEPRAGGGDAVSPIRVLSPVSSSAGSTRSNLLPSSPPLQRPPDVDSQVIPPSVLVGDKRSSDTEHGEGTGVPVHSRPFSSRLSLRPAPNLTASATALPNGGLMIKESMLSWLSGRSSERSRVEESFKDEFFESREEEKSEIVAVDEERANDAGNLGGPWSGRPLSPSLARGLPSRNEAFIEEDLVADGVCTAGAGNFRSSSARPATIEEEPSLGVTSGTSTTEGDASAIASPKGITDDDAGEQGPMAPHNLDYYGRGPIGISRLDSLTNSEKGNVLKAVKWVASPSSSSAGDSYYPDGFEDEGVYYTNSPMRTPMSGIEPGSDVAMGTAAFSPTIGPGELKRVATGHDDVHVDDVSIHSNLGSRHGDYKKKRKKRSVDFNRTVSIASGRSKQAGDNGYQTVHLCGRRVPFLRWPLFHISKPSWSRVSSFIVRHAPCFWCSQRFETAATDRAILIRLNVLCTFFAAVQVGAGLMSLLVQWSSGGTDEENQLRRESLTPNLWTLNGMIFLLALVGLVLIVTMLLTLRVIREVNLVGALRFYWALNWILPIEILLVIGLFDYHKVTDVWVKHWWATPSLDWFRDRFCFNYTSHTKCIVPVGGGEDYLTEEGWCEGNYNATDCGPIRDEAQENMRTATYTFMTVNGVCGVLLIILLFLALSMLEGIITKPIVRSSKQSNIPFWLFLPIIGCLVGGSVLLFSPSSATGDESGSNVFWIGITYMTSAGTFFIAALLGWFISVFSVLNNRDKRHKQIAILLFILTMVLTALSVAAIFSASLIYSASIVDVGFDDQTRGAIACYLDTANSCTHCDRDVRRCPEWTTDEVVKVLQTQLKQSATLAAILSIYAISALRFGFVLRKHLSRYQIDYV